MIDDEINELLDNVKLLTVSERKSLSHKDVFYDVLFARWSVTSAPKTWKTRPNDVSVSAKHGLYNFGVFTQIDFMFNTDNSTADKLRKLALSGNNNKVHSLVLKRFSNGLGN